MSHSSALGPLEQINRIIRENRIADYASPNLALGMSPLEFVAGASRWRWNPTAPAVVNPFGTIQGGYLAVFIDEMFSTAIGSVLEAGEWAVTAESKLSYLRALTAEIFEGDARVIRRTRTIAFLEATVNSPKGEPAVIASSTWAISRA